MKNSTIVPLFAVTAAAAFGLGWVARPDSNSSEQKSSSVSERGDSSRSVRSDTSSQRGSSGGGPAQEFLSRYLVAGEISSEDMKAAITEMSKVRDPLLRQKMFAALLENLTAENAKDAFLALQETRRGGPFGRRNEDEIRLLANAWGRIDGPGAVAALQEIAAERGDEEGGRRGRGRGDRGPGELSSVLAGWATVDGAAASEYVNGMEDGREQRGATFGVLQGMLVNGVDEAVSFIQTMPTGDDGDRTKGFAMAMVTDEMLKQGLEETKSWVDTVKDPELRTGALARVTMEIMQESREDAAEWIVQFGDEEAAAPAVDRLVDSWSRDDPQAVMEWAEQLSGKSKEAAYEEAMETWAREDPEAAGEYLANLQASPERDSAIGGYATRVSRDDPAAAMAWADTISNVETRQETQVDVARDWMRNDKAAAEAWIQSSGLPAEAVEQINERRDDRGRGRGR